MPKVELTEIEQDALAMALMGFVLDLPPELAAEHTPIHLSLVNKLNLKPALARAVESLTNRAVALREEAARGSDKP